MGSSQISWSLIRALSFDIYGTLVDWETGISTAARGTALGPYLPTSQRELLIAIERHDTSIQKAHPTMPQTQIIVEGLKSYAISELGLASKGHLTEDQINAAAKEYGSKIGDYPAFDDTVTAIRKLGKRFKLIPLSNVDVSSFSRTLSGPLKGCHFNAVYTAEEIGSYKPDIRNFHYLLEHVKSDFGVEKDQLVHVAQSLFHDHGPAKEAGIQSVWVDRKGVMGGDPEKAQERFGFKLKVDTLGDLAEIVEKALSE